MHFRDLFLRWFMERPSFACCTKRRFCGRRGESALEAYPPLPPEPNLSQAAAMQPPTVTEKEELIRGISASCRTTVPNSLASDLLLLPHFWEGPPGDRGGGGGGGGALKTRQCFPLLFQTRCTEQPQPPACIIRRGAPSPPYI